MTVDKSTFVSTPAVFSYNIPADQNGDIFTLEGDFPAGVYQGTSLPNSIVFTTDGNPAQVSSYNSSNFVTPEQITQGAVTITTNSYKKGHVYVNTRWMSRGPANGLIQSPGSVSSAFIGSTGIVITLSGGYVRRSTDDGVTWASSSVGQVSRITYHNGIYFATEGTYLYTSPAATVGTWTTRTRGMESIKGISYLPTSPTYKYLAKGYTSHDKVSTDGYTWVSVSNGVWNNSISNDYCEAVGAYWFGSVQSNSGLYYSTNGTTWTAATTPSTIYSGGVRKIAYGNGVYVAAYHCWNTAGNFSRGLWRSTNGTTWTTIADPGIGYVVGGQTQQIDVLAFGTGAGGVGKFYANQSISGGGGSYYGRFSTSTDGITWIPGYASSSATYNQSDAPLSGPYNSIARDSYGNSSLVGTYNNKWYYVQNDTSNFYLYNDQTARGRYTGGVTKGVVTYYGDTNSTLGTYLNTQI
jgi:hypothetical protein